MDGLLHLVARRISADGGDPHRFCELDRFRVGVDDDDVADFRARIQQLLHGLLTAAAEASEHNMIVQAFLNYSHTPVLPAALDQELGCGAEEDEPQENADRGDQEGIDQPGSLTDRHDVAIAYGRHRDHREIDDVGEADVTVDIVAQPVPVEPKDGEGQADQGEGNTDPNREAVPISPRAPLKRWKFPPARHAQVYPRRGVPVLPVLPPTLQLVSARYSP